MRSLTRRLLLISVFAISAFAQSPTKAVVDKYCVSCHGSRLKAGNLVLEGVDPVRVGEHSAIWEKVLLKLETRSMPPSGSRRPEPEQIKAMYTALETRVDRLALTTGSDPVPANKRARGYRHAADKFGLARLTPAASETIAAPGVAGTRRHLAQISVSATHRCLARAARPDRRFRSRSAIPHRSCIDPGAAPDARRPRRAGGSRRAPEA